MIGRLSVAKKIGLSLALGVFGIFLHSGTVNAAYENIPTTLPAEANQYINIGLTDQTTSGTGGYVPSATVKLYTKNPASIVGKTIPIQLAKPITDIGGSGNDCSQIRKIRYTINRVNSDGTIGAAQYTDYLRRSDGGVDILCSTAGLPINGNYFTASTRPERAGIYELSVQFTMEYSDACFLGGHSQNDGHTMSYHVANGFLYSNCFKPTSFLKINPPVAGQVNDLHMGYAAGGYLTLYSPYGATYSWPFAPLCTTTALSNTLFWGETDQGTSNQPASGFSIDVIVNGGTLPTITLTDRSSPSQNAYGRGQYGPYSIKESNGNPYNDPPWAAGYKYELRMSGVSGGNGIWASLPYDSGDFYLGCPKPFDTTGSANALVDDEENPTQITASGNVNEARPSGGTEAPVTTSTLSIKRYRNGVEQSVPNLPGSPSSVTNGNFSWVGQVRTMNLIYSIPDGVRSLGWEPGDRICSVLTWSNKKGTVVPGEPSTVTPEIVTGSVSSQSSGSGCVTIANRPYISAYNGDVAAGGGGLGLPCSNSGNIRSYFKNAGSGAQYAVYAMEGILGFKSAFLRDASYFPTAPHPPDDLTFGNTPSLGQYKLVDCATDFYSVDQFEDGDSRRNTAIPGSISATGLPDGGQSVRTGNLTLSGGGFTGKHSIFVDGDVFITGNIAYSSTSWANIAEIPYFNLVVRGNIYISQNVTQLDGRYIAQPRSDTEGGHIYTCAYAPGHPRAGQPVPTSPGSELWNQCGGVNPPSGNPPNRRLVINGQFVAMTVHFLRTINTISDGVVRETVANSKASEVFSLSPEIFLGQPATRPKSTSTSGEYQNITVLPPIL